MSYLTEHDLVRLLRTLGIVDSVGHVIGAGPVSLNDAAATQAVTAAMSGQAFRCAVDAVMTLPAMAAALKGIRYTFQCGAVSAGTGLSISPAAADAIQLAAGTKVINKDLINTGASDVLNDYVTIEGTGIPGVEAWKVIDIFGIWAKEA
jgi:hypothetical protein